MANMTNLLNPSAPRAATPIRLAGVVTKAYSSKPGFSTGIAEQANGATFKYCSKIKALSIAEGDALIFVGVMVTDKYGEQMQVQSVDSEGLHHTIEGMELYIAKNPKYRGIGPAAASRIAQACGTVEKFMEAADEFVDHGTGILAAVNLNNKSADAFKEAWELDRDTFMARIELAAFTLSPKQIEDLIAAHGNTVVAIIKKDPYLILKTIRGYGFKRLDQIVVEKMGGSKISPARIEAAALSVFADRCVDRGSTRMLTESFNDILFREYLVLDTHEQVATARGIIAGMIGQVFQDDHKPLLRATLDTLTTRGLWEMERAISDRLELASRQFVGTAQSIDLELQDRLTHEQWEAHQKAHRCPISVIIGGAGVGKTYTMASIVKTAIKKKLRVELGAFTGKAASRMTEMLRENGIMDPSLEGKTLHRILGADGSGFQRGPLHEDFGGFTDVLPKIDMLIIDEVSMLDVFLCHEVMTRWDPAQTKIVLIGDAAQLPSVGAGNILYDVLSRKLAPITALTKIQRQGGALAQVCQRVRDGNVQSTGEKDEFGEYRAIDTRATAARMGEGMQYQQDAAGYAISLIRRMFMDWLPGKCGFAREQIQIVCPFKDEKQSINTKAINRAIQEALWGAGCAEVNVGDRVMQTENDYEAGVFNGQFGVVVEIDNPKKPKKVTVQMDGMAAVRLMDGEGQPSGIELDWKKMEVAYAVTVHKSQGSQFPALIFACGAAPAGMLVDRSLIYTGISRAAKMAVVIGDLASIQNCARIHTASTRLTNLSLKPMAKSAAEIEADHVNSLAGGCE